MHTKIKDAEGDLAGPQPSAAFLLFHLEAIIGADLRRAPEAGGCAPVP